MEEIFTSHSDLFAMASQNHPFIKGCQKGTINQLQLNIWLLQDYKFMPHYVDFIKNLALIAPDGDKKGFWEEKACVAAEAMSNLMLAAIKKRGLSQLGSQYPATTRLIDFLELLKSRSYAVQVFAHFLFLKVYEDVWEYLRYLIVNGIPTDVDRAHYLDQKLTLNPGFVNMLGHIELIAKRELESGACDLDEASLVFEDIMTLEIGFWNLAFEMGQLDDFN